jgi:hypothetical protein
MTSSPGLVAPEGGRDHGLGVVRARVKAFHLGSVATYSVIFHHIIYVPSIRFIPVVYTRSTDRFGACL